jgi:hypothetical protein
MARFMVLYHAPASSAGQMDNVTPEQQKEVIDAWETWIERNKGSIAEIGAPLAGKKEVTSDSVTDKTDSTVWGYSFIEAASPEAVTEIVKGHPHFYTAESSIEVLEVQPVPGM